MKVLKFGGTSVANYINIEQVCSIIFSQNKNNVVVVSALGGVTNLLVKALHQAANGDENFSKTLQKIEKCHLEPIRAGIPAEKQSIAISYVKSELNYLETILDGVSILKEITPKTTAKVTSFGELLSSTIIYEILIPLN